MNGPGLSTRWWLAAPWLAGGAIGTAVAVVLALRTSPSLGQQDPATPAAAMATWPATLGLALVLSLGSLASVVSKATRPAGWGRPGAWTGAWLGMALAAVSPGDGIDPAPQLWHAVLCGAGAGTALWWCGRAAGRRWLRPVAEDLIGPRVEFPVRLGDGAGTLTAGPDELAARVTRDHPAVHAPTLATAGTGIIAGRWRWDELRAVEAGPGRHGGPALHLVVPTGERVVLPTEQADLVAATWTVRRHPHRYRQDLGARLWRASTEQWRRDRDIEGADDDFLSGYSLPYAVIVGIGFAAFLFFAVTDVPRRTYWLVMAAGFGYWLFRCVRTLAAVMREPARPSEVPARDPTDRGEHRPADRHDRPDPLR